MQTRTDKIRINDKENGSKNTVTEDKNEIMCVN